MRNVEVFQLKLCFSRWRLLTSVSWSYCIDRNRMEWLHVEAVDIEVFCISVFCFCIFWNVDVRYKPRLWSFYCMLKSSIITITTWFVTISVSCKQKADTSNLLWVRLQIPTVCSQFICQFNGKFCKLIPLTQTQYSSCSLLNNPFVFESRSWCFKMFISWWQLKVNKSWISTIKP